MHSYVESVSLAVPMYNGEETAVLGARRPNRLMLVGGALAVLACSALVLSAFTAAPGEGEAELTQKLVPKITPKFVDWKKEDAGSDDMNLHLKVADALARADGLAEKNLSPVPEKLLKEAQQAAEEQRSMPGIDGDAKKEAKKPKIPASLEKMFQQAEAEQKVEKLAKEGDRKRDEEAKSKEKKAAVKKAAAAKMATSKAEKSASIKLLNQVSQDAKASPKLPKAPAAAKVAKKAATHTYDIFIDRGAATHIAPYGRSARGAEIGVWLSGDGAWHGRVEWSVNGSVNGRVLRDDPLRCIY